MIRPLNQEEIGDPFSAEDQFVGRTMELDLTPHTNILQALQS